MKPCEVQSESVLPTMVKPLAVLAVSLIVVEEGPSPSMPTSPDQRSTPEMR